MYFNLTWARLGTHSHCFFDVAIGKLKNVHSLCIHLWERQPWIPCGKSLFLQWEMLLLQTTIKCSFPGFSCAPRTYTKSRGTFSYPQQVICTCNASSMWSVQVYGEEKRWKLRAHELAGTRQAGQSQNKQTNQKQPPKPNKTFVLGTLSCHMSVWAASIKELLSESLPGKLMHWAATILKQFPYSSLPTVNMLVTWWTLASSCCQTLKTHESLRCLRIPHVPCLALFQVSLSSIPQNSERKTAGDFYIFNQCTHTL